MILFLILALVAGYLLGSIPFAVIIAKAHGVDIFTQGSGNPGATNVKRLLGSKAGNLCFGLDVLKGIFATAWPLVLPFMGLLTFDQGTPVAVVGMVGAILGHSLSLFIKFRGGKGVAVTIGGLFALMPLVCLAGLIVWVILFYTTRYVSLASLGLAASLPLSALLLGLTAWHWGLALALMLTIFIRHRSNIQRLLQGKEHRFVPKSKRHPETPAS